MLRVTVVGSDTSGIAFLMGHDDPVSQRVKTVFLAQHSEEFYGGFVGPFHSSDSFRLIGASEGGTTHILDAGRLTHLNTDVGVVAGPATMPAPVIPGQGLVHCSIIGINEAVDAGVVVGALVPVLDENRSTRLGASNRVQHETFDCDFPPRHVARVLGHNRFNQFHFFPSERSCSCFRTVLTGSGTGSPR